MKNTIHGKNIPMPGSFDLIGEKWLEAAAHFRFANSCLCRNS